jgi:hypothetical protein
MDPELIGLLIRIRNSDLRICGSVSVRNIYRSENSFFQIYFRTFFRLTLTNRQSRPFFAKGQNMDSYQNGLGPPHCYLLQLSV